MFSAPQRVGTSTRIALNDYAGWRKLIRERTSKMPQLTTIDIYSAIYEALDNAPPSSLAIPAHRALNEAFRRLNLLDQLSQGLAYQKKTVAPLPPLFEREIA